MSPRIGPPPGAAVIEAMALAAFARIPAPFATHLDGIRVVIAEFADDETLGALGIEDPWELSGLYHGRPMDEESVWSTGEMPPLITLYRAPILLEWVETGVELEALVAHVVIHEVGHHFGLSDEQMHAIENAG